MTSSRACRAVRLAASASCSNTSTKGAAWAGRAVAAVPGGPSGSSSPSSSSDCGHRCAAADTSCAWTASMSCCSAPASCGPWTRPPAPGASATAGIGGGDNGVGPGPVPAIEAGAGPGGCALPTPTALGAAPLPVMEAAAEGRVWRPTCSVALTQKGPNSCSRPTHLRRGAVRQGQVGWSGGRGQAGAA
jgi:hypothetical protein